MFIFQHIQHYMVAEKLQLVIIVVVLLGAH